MQSVSGEPLLSYTLGSSVRRWNRTLLGVMSVLAVIWSISVIAFWWYLIPVVAIVIGATWWVTLRQERVGVFAYDHELVVRGWKEHRIAREDIAGFAVNTTLGRKFLTFEVKLKDHSRRHLTALEPGRGIPPRDDLDEVLKDLTSWLSHESAGA